MVPDAGVHLVDDEVRLQIIRHDAMLLLVELEEVATTAAPEVIDGGVMGDAEGPGLDRCAAPETGKTFGDLDQGLLTISA